MTDSTQTVHITVTYESPDVSSQEIIRGYKVVLEMDDRADDTLFTTGTVRIRHYPYTKMFGTAVVVNGILSNNKKLVVTRGALVPTAEVRTRPVSGNMTISGQDTFELPYPVVRNLQFAADGNWFDVNGNSVFNTPVGYSLTNAPFVIAYDPVRQIGRLPFPMYGSLRYYYETDYFIYRYTPVKYFDFETFYIASSDSYGEVLMFPDPPPLSTQGQEVSTFSIHAPKTFSSEYELYRIVSEAVVTDQGIWEKPTGFPTNGTYNNSDTILDFTKPYMSIQRVHEICYISLRDERRDAKGAKSVDYGKLPLDFTKSLDRLAAASPEGLTKKLDKEVQTLVGNLKLQGSFFLRNNQKLPEDFLQNSKNVPPVYYRLVRYSVPLAKPYEGETQPQPVKHVVIQDVAVNGQPVQRQELTPNQAYRIILTPIFAAPPTADGFDYGTGTLTTPESYKDNTYNAQAAAMNSMWAKVYNAVPWLQIGQAALKHYDNRFYNVQVSKFTEQWNKR